MSKKAWIWTVLFTSVICITGLICAAFFGMLQVDSAKAALPLNLIHTRTNTSTEFPSLTPTASFTPFQPATPTPTFTVTYTPTPTDTPTPTSTFTPTFTPSPTETPLPTVPPPEGLPSEAYITDITGYPQFANLDCESRTAVDFAAYFGISISETDFINQLPSSDNPNEGFVGSIYDEKGQIPPASYGVYAGPVAALLRAYGLNAWDQYWMNFDTIQSEVANGRPVMVWVIGNVWPGSGSSTYVAASGASVTVANWEHTVMVIGYDPQYVTILDGNLIYQRDIGTFLSSWSILGNMGILVE